MGPMPPEQWWDDLEREAIERSKAQRASNEPGIPAARVHEMLLELERRFNEAGQADPAIAQELCEKLKRGEPF